MLAVLISGSWRTFTRVWPENEKILKDLGIPYRVFVHSWSKMTETNRSVLEDFYRNKFHLSIHAEKFEHSPTEISPGSITNLVASAKFEIEDLDIDSISTAYKINRKEVNPHYTMELNTLLMYYGIQKVFRILESDSKRELFTHYLRIRPDFLLPSKGLKNLLENDFSLLGQLLPTSEGFIGDQCFIGKYPQFVYPLNAVDFMKSTIEKKGWPREGIDLLWTENVLRQHLKNWTNAPTISYVNEENSGQIIRPEIVRDESISILKNLQSVVLHNIQTGLKKIKQKLI